MYEIFLTKRSQKELDKIRRSDQTVYRRITAALEDDPHPKNSKPLTGNLNGHRLRVGTYRVLYRIQNNQLVIDVFRIGPRGDIYK